jgi:hypothetical protein
LEGQQHNDLRRREQLGKDMNCKKAKSYCNVKIGLEEKAVFGFSSRFLFFLFNYFMVMFS